MENDELWLIDFHVTPYVFGNRVNHEPLRRRKLLVHRKEIKRLSADRGRERLDPCSPEVLP